MADSAARKRVGQFRIEGFDEIWWDERVDPDWWASYRIVSDQGVPAVGEVRVYPYTAQTTPGGDRWTGYFPSGGLPARVLRRVTSKIPIGPKDWRGLRAKFGDLPQMTSIDPKARRAGRDVTPAFLAAVASAYVDIWATNPKSPIESTASKLGYSVRYTKHLVDRARAEGFLTSLGRGRSGGALTVKARDTLASSPTKGANDGR